MQEPYMILILKKFQLVYQIITILLTNKNLLHHSKIEKTLNI